MEHHRRMPGYHHDHQRVDRALPEHVGNPWILPALYIAGYVLQLIVDMYGAKKVMILMINAWLKKHGYEKVEA